MSKLHDAGIEARGGGWYRLPNGESVRGKSQALSAVNSSGDALTIERLDFARRAGLQYGGSRDVYKVAGYKKEPTYEDYWSYHDRHPIAGRIIDMPPQTTWRHPPGIVEPEQEDGTDFAKAFEELSGRLGMWGRMERVDRLARIGRYAVLLIGAKDAQSLEDLREPLERLSGPDDVAYLSHYSEKHARIQEWVSDHTDERFGMPETYRIDLSRGNPKFKAGTTLVHWSRVVHIAEDVLEDDVYGRPALRRVLNTIFNDEKVDAASAESFWQLADQILQLNIDPDASITPDQMTEIDTKIQALYHDLRKHFYLQGGELSWLGGETPDPTGLSDVLATKMAAGSGIPKRILFGSERGELASQQDERNWLGTIGERQIHHAEPNMLRALIDRLVAVGALPRPGKDGYECQWPNLYKSSEKEVAERNDLTAKTAASLTPVGGDPYQLVTVDSEGNVWLRDSEEVNKEREADPGLGIVDGDMDDEPPAAIEESEDPEEQVA